MNDKLIRNKLGVLNLAIELGNVSKVCKSVSSCLVFAAWRNSLYMLFSFGYLPECTLYHPVFAG